MKTRGLRQADRLFRAGRYPEVIRILEPQIFLYREDSSFYYLLGTSCLLSGDPGGAYSYLSRSSHIASENVNTLLALAATEIRRQRNDEALQLWLAVLEIDPRNRIARRGLSMMRGAESTAMVHEATDGERIMRYLPTRRPIVPNRVWMAAGVVLLAGLMIVVAPSAIAFLRAQGTTPTEPREGVELTRLDRLEASDHEITAFQGTFRYVLTETEIRESFRLMGEYFNNFRDNLAMMEINRILNSNASNELKRRAALLADFIRPPTFPTFTDNAAFAEVVREPSLYAGSYVKWSGRISNLQVTDEQILFDLLVGYETERVLEGVAPVALTFAAQLAPGMSVEIIGRVVADARFRSLDGTSIRIIAPGQDSVRN